VEVAIVVCALCERGRPLPQAAYLDVQDDDEYGAGMEGFTLFFCSPACRALFLAKLLEPQR